MREEGGGRSKEGQRGNDHKENRGSDSRSTNIIIRILTSDNEENKFLLKAKGL